MLQNLKTKAIDFLKANGLLLLGLVALGILFGNTCNCNGSVSPSKVDNAKVKQLDNDLKKALADLDQANKDRVADSVRHRREIDSITGLRNASADRARKAAQKASYWEGVAKQADEANDCETGRAARDSNIAQLKEELTEAYHQIALADSQFTRVSADLEMANLVNMKNTEVIQQQRDINLQLRADNAQLQKENTGLRKQAKRKKFWGGMWNGVKVGIGAAAGFIVGRTVK